MSRTMWYAEGLRWVGSILNDAADRLERNAAEPVQLDQRESRAIDQYVNDMRTRVHVHF